MGESTEDLAGGFSKYREELLARTGVDIQDEAGNYRDLYDIFVDLAGVWDNLADDQSRARVGEILGGTRNQAAIMSTIRNIKDAIGAYDSAVNSAGVAERANEKFMETTDAHLKQLKASWEELSYDLFESDFLKFFVDLGRGIIEVLDAIIDKIGILGALLATGGIVAFFKGGGVAGLIDGFSLLHTAIGSLLIDLGGIGTALSFALPIVGIIAAITAAVVLFGESFKDAQQKADEATTSYKNTQEKLEGVNKELETTQSRMAELEGKVLTPVEQEEYDRLVQMNEELERQQRILEHTAQVQREEAAKEAANVLTKDVGQYGNQAGSGDILDKIDEYTNLINRQNISRSRLLNSMEDNTNKQKALEEKIGKYSEDEKKIRQPWEVWKEASPYEKDLRDLNNLRKEQSNYEAELGKTDKTISKLEDQRSKDIETAEQYYGRIVDDQGNVLKGYEDIADKYDTVMNRVDSSIGKIADGTQAVGDSVDAAAEPAKNLTTVFQEQEQAIGSYQKTLSSIQNVLSSQTTGKSLSYDAFSSDELKAYSSALEYHNGVLQYNIEKVNEITAAKAEEQKATIANNKAQAQSQYLQNASEIERLRNVLTGYNRLSGEERAQVENNIQTLLTENSQLAEQCNAYNLMAASIDEATSAYQHWINAQSATQSGAMFDSSLNAFNKIRDTINGTGDANSADGWLKTGNEDYKAALDFVIPDTVDREDVSAVESYMDSIKSYLRFDDKGNIDGLNVENFLQDAVNKGLMTVDEAGEEFQVAGGKTMQDFAEGLNLSMPLVQAIFGELEEYDFHFDWADEAPKTLGDLAVNANEAAEAFRGMEEYSDIRLVLDVSKFEDADKATEALNNNIKQMNRVKSKVGVDASDVERANTIIQYCVAQKQALSQPAVMYVDTSQVSGQIGEALELLQQFQGIQNDIEMQASIGADTSDAEAALADVAGQINSLPEEVKTTLNIDTSSIDNISSYIQNLDAEAMVKFGVDSSAVDGYQAADQDPTVTYHLDAPPEPKYKDQHPDVTYSLHAPAEPTYNNIERTITYTYRTVGNPPSGAHKVQGTAHAFGTARASGDWGTAPGGTTLVGELG